MEPQGRGSPLNKPYYYRCGKSGFFYAYNNEINNEELQTDLTFGAAYHQNEIEDLSTHAAGVENGESMRIILLGANYSKDDFYLGVTFHVGENWEAASMGARTRCSIR
ncbi:hypothetical protein JGC56_14220 [Salmonella enterica subsp. enterica serovar Saintpaul]|nr:hypothetical protein [Salmonella enterica subsp. enterica serovar Saintpaul]